MIMNMLLFFNC